MSDLIGVFLYAKDLTNCRFVWKTDFLTK